jgi:hypothetical protein
MLFDGAPLAHVAAYRERQRLARIDYNNRAAIRSALGTRCRGRVVAFA